MKLGDHEQRIIAQMRDQGLPTLGEWLRTKFIRGETLADIRNQLDIARNVLQEHLDELLQEHTRGAKVETIPRVPDPAVKREEVQRTGTGLPRAPPERLKFVSDVRSWYPEDADIDSKADYLIDLAYIDWKESGDSRRSMIFNYLRPDGDEARLLYLERIERERQIEADQGAFPFDNP